MFEQSFLQVNFNLHSGEVITYENEKIRKNEYKLMIFNLNFIFCEIIKFYNICLKYDKI